MYLSFVKTSFLMINSSGYLLDTHTAWDLEQDSFHRRDMGRLSRRPGPSLKPTIYNYQSLRYSSKPTLYPNISLSTPLIRLPTSFLLNHLSNRSPILSNWLYSHHEKQCYDQIRPSWRKILVSQFRLSAFVNSSVNTKKILYMNIISESINRYIFQARWVLVHPWYCYSTI